MRSKSLQGSYFEGYFNGRRNRDGVYYDVVELSPSESEFTGRLAELIGFRAFTKGGGAGEPPGPALWTRLPDDTPLGCHWFVVRSFRQGEILLESVKHLPDKEPLPIPKIVEERAPAPSLDMRLVIDCLKITAAVVASLVVGAFKIVEFTGDFLIRFMHASSLFVEKSTPMFTVGSEFLWKICAGFFTFSAMVVQRLTGGRAPNRSRPRRPALPAPRYQYMYSENAAPNTID